MCMNMCIILQHLMDMSMVLILKMSMGEMQLNPSRTHPIVTPMMEHKIGKGKTDNSGHVYWFI